MANYDWRILSGNSLDGFRRFHEKAPETSLIPRLHFFLPGFPFTPFPFCVPLFCRCIVCCFLCRALSICSLDFSSFPRGLKLFPTTPFLLAEYLLPLLPKAGKRITKTKICIKTIAPSTRNSLDITLMRNSLKCSSVSALRIQSPKMTVAQSNAYAWKKRKKKTVEVFEVVFTFLASSIFRSRSILLTIFGSGNVHLVSL